MSSADVEAAMHAGPGFGHVGCESGSGMGAGAGSGMEIGGSARDAGDPNAETMAMVKARLS